MHFVTAFGCDKCEINADLDIDGDDWCSEVEERLESSRHSIPEIALGAVGTGASGSGGLNRSGQVPIPKLSNHDIMDKLTQMMISMLSMVTKEDLKILKQEVISDAIQLISNVITPFRDRISNFEANVNTSTSMMPEGTIIIH